MAINVFSCIICAVFACASPLTSIPACCNALEAALQEEDYETAAACRDKIHSLEGEMRHDEMV